MNLFTSRLCNLPVTLVALLLVTPTPVSSFWPFPPKRFTKNSLLNTGSLGVGLDERIVAFGDFNADQFMDLLTLDKSQQLISIYLWNHDTFTFDKNHTFAHPSSISNIIPGDYTHDGLLDLLVMSPSKSKSKELEMTVYVSLPFGGFDVLHPRTIPPSTLSQPIPIDANGDMLIDLLGTPASSSALNIWRNVYNSSEPNGNIFDVTEPLFSGKPCALADPHSSAIVDLDGDCLADLFLHCNDGSYQIWINNKDKGYSLHTRGQLPSGTLTVSFADMDRDGTMDMVLTACSSTSFTTGLGNRCTISIAYNQQLMLCAVNDSQSGKGCRNPDELCNADPGFTFNMTDTPSNTAFVSIPVSSFSASHPNLLVYDATHNPPIPLPVKLGDINLDGFPDLLFIGASSDGASHTPILFASVDCAKDVTGCSKDGKGRRGFQEVIQGAETMTDVSDAKGVSFLDLDEDGTLDIMVQRTGADGHGNVKFVQNNIYYDAFFLKAIVLDGACNSGWCTTVNSLERYMPLGVSYSGATYKYTVLDTTGRRSAAQVGQLPQSTYHSLLTPYAFFGLGRTNNYIENLFVGSTKHTTDHYINMEGVIPNSKLVISPPNGRKEGEEWKRQLFLRPGEWIPWVTVTVIATTLVLAIIVWVLRLHEKREDELERRRLSHHINFDAL